MKLKLKRKQIKSLLKLLGEGGEYTDPDNRDEQEDDDPYPISVSEKKPPRSILAFKAFWWNGGLHLVPNNSSEEGALNQVLDGLGITVHEDDPDLGRL